MGGVVGRIIGQVWLFPALLLSKSSLRSQSAELASKFILCYLCVRNSACINTHAVAFCSDVRCLVAGRRDFSTVEILILDDYSTDGTCSLTNNIERCMVVRSKTIGWLAGTSYTMYGRLFRYVLPTHASLQELTMSCLRLLARRHIFGALFRWFGNLKGRSAFPSTPPLEIGNGFPFRVLEFSCSRRFIAFTSICWS